MEDLEENLVISVHMHEILKNKLKTKEMSI